MLSTLSACINVCLSVFLYYLRDTKLPMPTLKNLNFGGATLKMSTRGAPTQVFTFVGGGVTLSEFPGAEREPFSGISRIYFHKIKGVFHGQKYWDKRLLHILQRELARNIRLTLVLRRCIQLLFWIRNICSCV